MKHPSRRPPLTLRALGLRRRIVPALTIAIEAAMGAGSEQQQET